jgi:ribonuclease Z
MRTEEKYPFPMLPAKGKKGKTVSLLGDTCLCKGLYSCMEKADLAVIESTFLEDQAQRALERTHLTAKEAGNVAERSGVKELLLYHFSASYPLIDDFKKECSEKFSGTINLAEDLKEIII